MRIQSYEMTPFLENCYVIEDGGEAVIIDPGECIQELRDLAVSRRVTMIINTHCHIDHVGGNAELVRLSGAPLLCHQADLPLLRAVEQQGRMFGVSVEPSPDPDRFIAEGDTIHVGAVAMRVLHTPGHAPGHVVLLGEGFVIGGDVLFSGSIGRTDLPGGNHEQLLHSIQTKLLTLPDDTVVYPGHGPATTIGHERRHNPFLTGS